MAPGLPVPAGADGTQISLNPAPEMVPTSAPSDPPSHSRPGTRTRPTSLGERILVALSRDPGQGDYGDAVNAWTLDTALGPLRRSFPDLPRLVAGRRVVDFGCGQGWQSAALAREGASFVLGLDTNARALQRARTVAAGAGFGEERVRFSEQLPAELAGTFDLVISQNSMEHFADPLAVLGAMRRALHPGGRVLISFGPPWYAPTGSHMHFFTRVPWVNVVFSERTVMAVRNRFRSDGARRYEEVESGLNRMSVAKFERTVAASGMRIERCHYRCVKGVDILGRIPVARELFINQVDCLLAPASDGAATRPPPALRAGPTPCFVQPGPSAGRRMLLVSYHFPPGQSTGALRWQKLVGYGRARGWSFDVVTVDPGDLRTTDPSRLAELPPGTRLYGVPLPAQRWRRIDAAAPRVLRLLRGLRTLVRPAAPPATASAIAVLPDMVRRGEVRWSLHPSAILRALRVLQRYGADRRWARAAGATAVALARTQRYDAVISCGPPHLPHVAASGAARRAGIPHVMDMRDPWYLIPILGRSIASPLYFAIAGRLERKVVDRAALVVANTGLLCAAMRERYPAAASRTVAVLNGCDEEEKPPRRERQRFVMAYAGNIYIDRDPRFVFRAAASLIAEFALAPAQLGIELIGHVQEFGGAPVERLAEEAGLDGYVTILPRLPRAEALERLAHASVLISLPQDVDLAIPSKIYEYMQFDAWILALATRGSATELLLRDTSADVVDPADEAGIAAAVRRRYLDFTRGVRPRPVNEDGRFDRRHQADLLFDAIDRLTWGRPPAP